MLLDTSWRSRIQDNLVQRAQEDSMKTPEKVKELIDIQFAEFVEPIKELMEITENNDFYRYKAYDRAMDVEFSNNKIVFSRVMFSACGKEITKEYVAELNHNGSVFVQVIGKGQPDEYINTAKIEKIIKNCFSLGIGLRK